MIAGWCRANLTQRLPFSMHVLVHGSGMLVELTTISERCRQAGCPLEHCLKPESKWNVAALAQVLQM